MSNALKIASAFGGAGGNKSLYQTISDLGLTANLKLCLDAGDSASYDPAVQTDKWLDTSGNGYDFYRGTGTGSDSRDPTFNGSAGGLSSNEYWSFDGGDCFVYDSTVETWMQNLSRAGAVWSMLCVIQIADFSIAGIVTDTRRSADLRSGWANRIGATEVPVIVVAAPSASTVEYIASTALPIGTWAVTQWSWNEAGGAGGSIFSEDAAQETFDGAYATPSSGSEEPMTIGASSQRTNAFLPAGTRLACLAIWEGTALTSTNLTDLYNAIKGRFGL